MKTIFFGTQQFAATILTGMINDPLFDIILVVTQPDRPVGRHQELQKPPVKLVAEAHHIPVAQPETLRGFDLPPSDIAIVAQYGLIIPKQLLDAPAHGMINVHGSLLPRYRGATPIQTALVNGDAVTGVTIMVMDAGMDTGPTLLQAELPINISDNYTTLESKLAAISIPLLSKAVDGYVSGSLKPIPQNNEHATLCRLFTREDGRIHWNNTAAEIYHQFQGMTPWPGIWCTWQGKRLKLLSITPSEKTIAPGFVSVNEGRIYLGCSGGSIEILELQIEGKKPMSPQVFLQGHKEFSGSRCE